MIQNVKQFIVEFGSDPCLVDSEKMHNMLLRLPAEVYIQIYFLMKERMENPNIFYNFAGDNAEKIMRDMENERID